MTIKSPLNPRNSYGLCDGYNQWGVVPDMYPVDISSEAIQRKLQEAAEKAAQADRDQRRTVALPGIAYDRAGAPRVEEKLDPSNAGDAMFIRARQLAKGEGPMKFKLQHVQDMGNSVDYRYVVEYDGARDLTKPTDTPAIIDLAKSLFILRTTEIFQRGHSQMKESRVVRVAIVTDSDITE